MRGRLIAIAIAVLAHAPGAWAQRSIASAPKSAAEPLVQREAEALVATGQSLVSRTAQPEQTPWWVGPDPAADQTRIVTEFLSELPIERVQRVLQHPGMFR